MRLVSNNFGNPARVESAAPVELALRAVPPPEPLPHPPRMRDFCLPLGLDPDVARDLDRLFVQPRRIPRKEALYRAGAPFTALHAVREGTIKTVVLAEDGREQITGYHMAGDIVGLDGLGQSHHSCDAFALEDSEVCTLPFGRLDELALDPQLVRSLFQLMARDLRRSQDLIVLLGSMCAEERLATFLLNLARREHLRGHSARELLLRMTREEIASFLGLKLETVSRIFSRLQGDGLLHVQGRAVTVLDRAGLERAAGHQ